MTGEKLNKRWLLWCKAEGRNPDLNFGGCKSNAEYMDFINKNVNDYCRLNNIAGERINQAGFDAFLESKYGNTL